MNAIHDKPGEDLYSAKNSHRPVNFYLEAPRAKSVAITGDFSRWTPVQMQPRVDGWWFIQVLLAHGHHLYRFLVDGEPLLDPQASGTGHDDHNEPASLVAVS